MKLKTGQDYEIRLLGEPNEKIVRFAVTSKEAKDRNGNRFFEKLLKEGMFAIPAKKFVGLIPANPHKLVVLEKGFGCATKGKKLLMV